MTAPTDSSSFLTLEQARDELREGLEHSREIVRQSHVLIELSETDPPFAANDNPDD